MDLSKEQVINWLNKKKEESTSLGEVYPEFFMDDLISDFEQDISDGLI